MTEAHLTILTLHMVCFVFRMVCSPLDSSRLFVPLLSFVEEFAVDVYGYDLEGVNDL